MLPLLGYPAGTVPALRLGDRRVQTNIDLARALDEIQPDPPLFPADPEQRRKVEEAERWGDEVFQMVARRIALAGALHGPDGLLNHGAAGRLGPLLWRRDRARLIGARAVGRFVFNVNPATEERLLRDLPGHLDRIDAWVEDGVLAGEMPNAADYAIGTSLALLTYRPDLRADLESRPAIRVADAVLPEPGTITPVPA
jgi:glutathione S-transferase